MEGHEIRHHELPEPEELRDRMSHLTALALVGATVAAALVGFLHTVADRHYDEATLEEQELATLAAGSEQVISQWAQTQYDAFTLAREQRARQWASYQDVLFGGRSPRSEMERELWAKVANRTEKLTRIIARTFTSVDLAGEFGPGEDPGFPSRFFAEITRGAVRLQALQSATNDRRTGWSNRVASLTAILTMLAVSLYLLGFSLLLRGGIRKLFVGIGVGLLVTGLAWAGIITANRPEEASEAAAEHFASGHVALLRASDRSDYAEAEHELTEALDLYPGFAAAYENRAEAIFQGESPQTPGPPTVTTTLPGLTSVTTIEALHRSTADLRRARDLGLRNVKVVGNLGFYMFLLGLLDDRPELFEESIELSREAIELAPRQPVPRYNLGVALLAAGRKTEAAAAYREAVRVTQPYDEGLLAGVLTDLENLRRHRPDLADEVLATKQRLVGTILREAQDTAGASVGDLEISVSPSEVRLTGTFRGFNPNRDLASTQWYYRPGGSDWFALADVSGYAVIPGPGGRFIDVRAYLSQTFPPRCLLDGRYRVEVYVNGELVGEHEDRVDGLGQLAPGTDVGVNVGVCRPESWGPSTASLPGFLTGFVSPQGDEGVYVFRVSRPADLLAAGPRSVSASTRDGVLATFHQRLLGAKAPPRPVERLRPTDLMGLDGSVVHRYRFGRGYLLAGAGVDRREGAVMVALLFGPQAAPGAPSPTWDSLVLYRPVSG